MEKALRYASRFWKEEEAVTIVELVIIIAVILLLLIPILGDLAKTEEDKLKDLQEKLSK